jgi:hypothetical protein
LIWSKVHMIMGFRSYRPSRKETEPRTCVAAALKPFLSDTV